MTQTPTWYWTGAPKPCEHFPCHDSGKRMCHYTGKLWYSIVVDTSIPHNILDCPGNCKQIFHTVSNIQLAHADVKGVSWGELVYFWDQEDSVKRTPEEVAKLEELERQREAQEKLDAEANRMSNYMRDIEIKRGCKGEKEKPKIQSPCKYLYCTPGVEGRYQNDICSECWGYEYHCPKTGKLVKAQKGKECPYLHPGESGWLIEWNTDRRFGNSGRSSPSDVRQNNRFVNLIATPKAKRFGA
jgi:hypothetical protein